MNKVFWVTAMMVSFLSFTSAEPHFNCPNFEIKTEEDKLEIKRLTAPREIVKVFDANYNLIYQCYGDCPQEVKLENLSEGDYHVDIQAYTSNWQFICDKKKTVTINSGNTPSCSTIGIEVTYNKLTLSNLTASNSIIKIFDVFYNLIDVCYGDCGPTMTILNLLSGTYHIDIQFYTANWQFICDRKEDVLIDLGVQPCDSSSCLGNITLTTQAQIDEFCGCTIVEGDLKIGKIGSNISSLSNLRDIQRINGNLEILDTDIQNFDGLGNLGRVGGDLIISKNQFLKDFQGLNNLVEISNRFQLNDNSKIKDLIGFDRLTKTNSIDFDNNDKLEKVEKLALIENLQSITLRNNAALETIPQLMLIDSINGLTINDNPKFKNLDFISPIIYLSGVVSIKRNASLSDCCGLYHLIDDDPFFGSNNATFNISNNPFSCNSISNIIAECQTNEPSCNDIQVNATSNKITISGLTAANEILKVFDKNYAVLYNCFGNCDDPIFVNNLASGLYRISINFYDENWIPICETIVTLVLNGNGNTVSFSDRNSDLHLINESNFSLSPNPALAVTFLDLRTAKGNAVQLQLINQFGQKVWEKQIEKVTGQPEKIDLYTFQNGLYFLQIQQKGRAFVSKKLLINRLY